MMMQSRTKKNECEVVYITFLVFYIVVSGIFNVTSWKSVKNKTTENKGFFIKYYS